MQMLSLGFGKNYYDLYYLKYGGVVCGKLGVYENVGEVSTGGPHVRSLKTPSPRILDPV